ncbi:dipeptidyl-peptidase 4 S homeolog [Xenopus laevis]|uniref:Dipeptidyl peptidase 4 n=1 Tax=Xenopus laevis TaxID=8355 RepID=P70092_XENLA|nr:dipeptidyl-peptidase 4 S homeolog [Xenopus laevis]CAA70136.1 dipeptidyl-peptidase IV [Xenopus laevis]
MKTWLKWLFGILMGAVVVTVVAVPVALLATKGKGDDRKTFTLEDYFSDEYRPKSFGLKWVSENEFVFRDKDNVLIFNVDNETTTEIISNTTIHNSNSSFYTLSEDRKYALQYNYEKLWRHSYTASYHIYDIEKKEIVAANELPNKIQYITWSPVGHKLAYVWENNIYIKEVPGGISTTITTNGEHNKILNGIPDWVYEEEMFSTNYALWWSPDATSLAYVEFNDTDVPVIEYSFYGEDSDQYPHTVVIPYPKAGARNPTVRLFAVNTRSLAVINPVEILPPEELRSIDHYISGINWVTDNKMAVQWLRRIQNVSLLTMCEGAAWNCQPPVYKQSSTGWVGYFQPSAPYFTQDGLKYYKIISNKEGYKHIHLFEGSKDPVAITSGNWEVTSIATVASNFLYYVSNEGFPGRRQLYKIRLDSGSYSAQCVTCNTRQERCQQYSAYFSKNSKYYSLNCNGPGLPIYTVYNSSNDNETRTMEDNEDLKLLLDEIQMPTKENKSIIIDGFELWYQLTLPPHFDKSKKYPLLIDVYGGPGSQKVDQFFRLNWATYLASTEKIIVASLDGRGSGYQGDKIMHQIYHKLGTLEVQDQITAAKHFSSLGFVDPKRMAIWGWSYGGYVTSMVLGSGSGLFKCGIAVAPVSSWHYYDSIYTERYMGLPTPEDNLDNYLSSTVMARAQKFKDVEYLLIHGTADDNVHFQQAAHISKALVDAQVDFETMWYTDKDHGIGGTANRHIYTHMSHFLKQCFNIQ